MKTRLVAGTINHWADDEEWHNTHLDISDRKLYSGALNMLVAPDIVADLAGELPMIPSETFDEVRVHHVLEHMNYEAATHAASSIFRVLKPGGVLDVEVPDMDKIAQAWVDGRFTKDELQQWLYGEDLGGPADGHRYGWHEEKLRGLLLNAGFELGEKEVSDLALRLLARKP